MPARLTRTMASSYKETLNLPRTDFPMKAALVEREPQFLQRWETSGLYARIQAARAAAPAYVLHDGPPFANGPVHMGTALNKLLKDLVVKSKTMAGFRAPFVPGWDCHGLPIEFKVVKESRGLSPAEVRKRSEKLAREFIDIQRRQFKRLGVFGDWENPYLTLDPAYEADILRAFADLLEKGLVYRSLKPVFWSTGAQTALAEAEVEYQEKESPSIYVAFPLVSGPLAGQAELALWTTTPWTLPANLAVAVHHGVPYAARRWRHPGTGSERVLVMAEALKEAFARETGYATEGEPVATFSGDRLVGSKARHPFLDREAEVFAADFVTMDTGTGLVHIAPGHGEDDYHLGRHHGLPLLSPVDDNGRFTAECGVPALVGKYVFDANPDVIALLGERGALLGHVPYRHSYPHCWRSKTPVIFRAVEQFFIRLDDLKPKALEAIEGIRWIPAWGRNRIRGTVESRPDWCISRQRAWGVPLPVFYRPDGEPLADAALARKVADLVERHGTNIWFEWDDARWNETLGLPAGTTRRQDTLDVWIDSGVSHTAVLRRNPALRAPADLYLEATDQHRGWFQSSLMTSVALHGAAPYRACLTHGFVVDVDGKKISKSSSYEKPMDAEHFVGKYGADLVRLWVSSVDFTDEVPFSEETFTRLSDAYRRIRNTLRILLANLFDFEPAADAVPFARMPAVDRWILGRLAETIGTCRQAYEAFEFHKAGHALTQFCAVDLSSLYIDITKDRLYCDAPASPRRRATQTAMRLVLDALTRLLAPILAFTADEAWLAAGHTDSVHLELFPEVDPAWADAALAQKMERWLALRSLVAREVEAARQSKLIGNALEADVTIELADAKELASLEADRGELAEFLILSDVGLAPGPADRARLTKGGHGRCDRCWRHRPSVGQQPGHPQLCDRCAEAVAAR